MKQTKWQRLATIGLCSSLVINAFSGVTAVAETVTIESSPTAESSAKEETQASSVKEETTKASTENSQVTTDTSQEEETKEAEKQAETEVKEAQKSIEESNLGLSESPVIEPRVITPKASISLPQTTLNWAVIDEMGNSVPLDTPISGNRYSGQFGKHVNHGGVNSTPYSTSYAGKTIHFNRLVVPGLVFSDTSEAYIYGLRVLRVTLPRMYQGLTFQRTAGSLPLTYATVYGNNGQTLQTRVIMNEALVLTTGNTYGVRETGGLGNISVKFSGAHLFLGAWSTPSVPSNYSFSVYTPVTPTNNMNISYLYTQRRKVTEKFVDANGVAITPPTGFTQNRKTPMTSNAFTFKQAGTLPDTYTTGGKTYKFKGWYKGKTKPSTLTTTKAPSYKVTYDGNDDLNVVYEETNFPAVTYQFGFVNEAGQLVNPADIKITYDYKSVDYRRATSAFSYGTIADNQSAPTVGNLKNVSFPETYIARPTEGGWNGEAYSNFSIKLPRYYQSLNLYDKTNKINPNYPLPVITQNYSASDNVVLSETAAISLLTATQRPDQSYTPKEQVSGEGRYPTLLRRLISSIDVASGSATYQTLSGPVYYHLTNRKVTENFVDTSGAKITPPTGFTQGKQTAITSDPYTFKQAGTLPDTYTTGGKTYKFKGWYRGKTKPSTLTTTKAPSYGVTYDGNDDLNVVYEEETVTTFYPSVNMNFVNEKGGAFTPALTFSGKYYVRRNSDNVITNLYDVTSKSKGNGQYTVSINNGSVPLSQELFRKYTNGYLPMVPNSLAFRLDKLAIDQQLKYVDSIQVEAAQSSGLNVYGYDYTNSSSTIIDSSVAPTVSNLSTADINGLNFKTDGTNFSNTSFRFLGMTIGSSMNANGSYLFFTNLFSNNPTNDAKLVYKVTRKQVTENFVDVNGAKITAPTGFTQGNQVPMNSNTFKYTAAKALPATYTAGGKTYTFQGWYKGKTKPSTLNKTTTPTFNATFDGNDDMTAMYKEEIPTASVTLTRPKEVIDTNTNVIWTTTITNTSKAPLQNLNLKKGPNWSAGLTIPTFMEVTPEGETTKSIPVNSTLWTEGVSLPNALPIGKKVSIAFTTRATGKPNTVLKAEVVVFGGIKDSTVDNFVRIRPNDQEVVTPTTEGFISVPTFDFGQVGVAGSKQQHSLKQAADYYGNGTRNPYLRIKKTQPNWSLTAQLSQPKSATDSLPTATRLLLGAAPVSSFTNYNQPTELKNAVGTTSAISLTANNTATSIIANKQFTGSNVYQLDFTFNNVKLEVPANQGVKGQQYKAAVTWNLVTGP